MLPRNQQDSGPRPAGWPGRHDEEPDLKRDLPIVKARFEKLNPPPVRKIPILIASMGEQIGMRIVAEHADKWSRLRTAGEDRSEDRSPETAVPGDRQGLLRHRAHDVVLPEYPAAGDQPGRIREAPHPQHHSTATRAGLGPWLSARADSVARSTAIAEGVVRHSYAPVTDLRHARSFLSRLISHSGPWGLKMRWRMPSLRYISGSASASPSMCGM